MAVCRWRNVRPSDTVYGGEKLVLEAESGSGKIRQAGSYCPDVIWRRRLTDDKQAGGSGCASCGHQDGTLLSTRCCTMQPDLAKGAARRYCARLDKGTTGLMVVAKTLVAQTDLLRSATVTRNTRPWWLEDDRWRQGGSAYRPAWHQPAKMAVAVGGAAVSHYRVISRFRAHTHVRVKLETGRTHRFRSHELHPFP
jgi:23S rRNA pseudouridine1911/1915/1917 synthase